MRSLIIALAIIFTITGLSVFHSVTASRRAGDLVDVIDGLKSPEDADRFETDWEELESLLRVTVHEERLRSVRSAIAELRSAVAGEGDRERAAALLRAAIDDAVSREKPLIRQIF